MDRFETDILKKIVNSMPERTDHTLLGNVLAIGSYLVSNKLIPVDVIENRQGAYALSIATTKNPVIKTLHIGDKLVVGREVGENGWKVEDPWMSCCHFAILVDDQGVAFLEPYATKNGTFVNDKSVVEFIALKRGDVIRAGNTSFILF